MPRTPDGGWKLDDAPFVYGDKKKPEPEKKDDEKKDEKSRHG
ncbi:MAG TPA: hypothetical protein VMZ92_03035 [Planctomycetota bacterium]|nr:hypothetical protein [Planctomycetota bacterium]